MEANVRAQLNLKVNLPQDDNDLNKTIEEIERKYEERIEQDCRLREELIAAYEKKARHCSAVTFYFLPENIQMFSLSYFYFESYSILQIFYNSVSRKKKLAMVFWSSTV